jgi:general secretion pathway protein N
MWFTRTFVVALWLATPGVAATHFGTIAANGPESDNSVPDIARPATLPPNIPAKPQTASTDNANPLWAIPLTALPATQGRPLFTPSRHPPAPVAVRAPAAAPPPPPPPPPPAPEHPNFVLIGTASGESLNVAVVIDNATRNPVRLRSGEGLGGWILQSVVHRTATLQKGGQTETLELPRPTDLKGPVPVVSTLPPGPVLPGPVLPGPVPQGPVRPSGPPPRPQSPPPALPVPPAPAKPL